MGRLLLGLVIGAAAIYGAFNYHIVKTDSGFQLVPKRAASLSDTYVDVRNFGISDWAAHSTLSADIVAAEKANIMGQSATQSVENGARQVLTELRQ